MAFLSLFITFVSLAAVQAQLTRWVYTASYDSTSCKSADASSYGYQNNEICTSGTLYSTTSGTYETIWDYISCDTNSSDSPWTYTVYTQSSGTLDCQASNLATTVTGTGVECSSFEYDGDMFYFQINCEESLQGYTDDSTDDGGDDDDSDATCFAGTEPVLLESGASAPISTVKLGDRVQVLREDGTFGFSDVVALPHAFNEQSASFVHLHTAAQDIQVKLTPEHLLPAGSCSAAQLPLIPAKQVVIGDCVLTTNGRSVVSSIDMVQQKGIYTVVTREEYVVVGGYCGIPLRIQPPACTPVLQFTSRVAGEFHATVTIQFGS